MKKQTDIITRLLNAGNGLVSACAGLLAVVLILYSGYVLYDSFATEVSAFSSGSDLLKYKPSVLARSGDDKPAPEDVIKDYRAWITVPDTPIDYPVVQGKDDLYYASHDVYKKSSVSGAIYLAAGNKADFSDSYNILFGHHMDNGAMFGSLDRFKNKNYFYSHQTATLVTKKGKIYDVTFFAVATTDAYEKQIYTPGNRARQVKKFLTGDRSHDTGIGTKVLIYDKAVANTATKVIALSTCASADTNGRLVVFGRMVERTPGRKVKLTVKYYIGDKKVFPDEIYTYEIGGHYYVVVPQIPGYEADIEIIQGTIYEDTVVIVHYKPKVYHLTIHYLYPDGTPAADPYQAEIRTGEDYDVESPVIPGYRALRARIFGTNPGRDETFIVFYVPDDDPSYNDPGRTPLNPGDIYHQIGICAE